MRWVWERKAAVDAAVTAGILLTSGAPLASIPRFQRSNPWVLHGQRRQNHGHAPLWAGAGPDFTHLRRAGTLSEGRRRG